MEVHDELEPDERPLLDQLDDLFGTLPWRLDRAEVAPGVPPEPMAPRELRNWLLDASTSYETRDRVWAVIVTRARRSDPAGGIHCLAALGLAVSGLYRFGRRIHLRSTQELPDVHADLVCGFLTRLATIDTTRRNIAGRLISSAIGYAARRHQHRQTHIEVYPLDRKVDTGSEEIRLYQLAAELAETGQPVDLRDVHLIAMTRLDRHTIIGAAARLGLTVEAAYKRRQRAEARLRPLLPAIPGATAAPIPRQPEGESTRPTTAGSGATAAEATPEPRTRQTAATPETH